MGILVYPRLTELLDEQHLTIAELAQRIAERFGLAVDPQALRHLTRLAPLRQMDIELAAAAAIALGVGLDDLFTLTALDEGDAAMLDILGSSDSRRLDALLGRREPLNMEERAELDGLLARYGEQLHQGRMKALADQRGVSTEQLERDHAARMTTARAWWDAFERDPHHEQELDRAAVDLRARWPA